MHLVGFIIRIYTTIYRREFTNELMSHILLFNAIPVLCQAISFTVLYINESRCARGTKSGRAKAQRVFNKKRTLFAGKWDLNLQNKLAKFDIWKTALCDDETWAFRKVDQTGLASFEMCCWRRTEKIMWADRVGDEVLYRVREGRNILNIIRKKEGELDCSHFT